MASAPFLLAWKGPEACLKVSGPLCLYICCISFLSIRLILSLVVSVLVWPNLVDDFADFLYQRGASSGTLAGMGSAVCMVRVSSLMALLSPSVTAPSAKKATTLTAHNAFRRLFGGPGVFLPEVEERGAPFQDGVIDTGMG